MRVSIVRCVPFMHGNTHADLGVGCGAAQMKKTNAEAKQSSTFGVVAIVLDCSLVLCV